MPSKLPKIEKMAQSQVLELLGKLLYVCNSIELKLRWMHKHSGGFWVGKNPKDLLNVVKRSVEQKQKDDKRPLGPVGAEMLDSIYKPRCDKDIDDAEKRGLLVFKIDYKIEGEERLLHAKEKFTKFIDARNYLVHYFARDYDLTNAESCKKARENLQSKSAIIKDAADFFEDDFNMMMACLQGISEKLMKCIASATGCCGGVPARKGGEQRSASEGTTVQGESRSKRRLI